jgi:DNA repair photolyase
MITKSNLVTRDTDVLSRVPCTVALTITTDDENKAKLMEPNAPSPTERLKAIETLTRKGIPVSVRVDPIIPFVNDNPEKLIATLAGMGVKHVTTSTYKVKPDNWRRLTAAMPQVAEKLASLYFEQGEKRAGYMLLTIDLRLKLLENVRRLAMENGMKFGVCREGLAQLNTAACDGSWLIKTRPR